MKKIGIVGGLGWRSTANYYAGICRLSEQWHLARDPAVLPATPEIAIESLDLCTAVSYIGREGDAASWSRFDDYHRDALLRLQATGADFAVIASNTPHTRFASITRGVGIPVLSIFEATASLCARIGVTRVLILGTAVTMASAGFPEAFREYGIDARAPADLGVHATTTELIADFQAGRLIGADERVLRLVRSTIGSAIAPAVCLGCTELPLAFPGKELLTTFRYDGVRYINPAAIHIEAAFRFALAEKDCATSPKGPN